MEVNTITSLKEVYLETTALLKKRKPVDFADVKYGYEAEYSASKLLALMHRLVKDLKTALSTPTKFLDKTTFNERDSILSQFNNIREGLINRDLSSAAHSCDQLKSTFRLIGIGDWPESELSSIDYSEELAESAVKICDEISSLEKIHQDFIARISDIEQKLERVDLSFLHVENRMPEFEQSLSKASNFVSSISDLKVSSEEFFGRISVMKSDLDSVKVTVDEFIKKITQREIVLEKQNELSEQFGIRLQEIDSRHGDLEQEALDLIKSAKDALGYKTAEGLSAAFTKKHEESAKDKSTYLWLAASGAFFIFAVILGLVITFKGSASLEVLIGRISLIPILLGATWFTASQYVKQKDLAENYAYKSVLVKSMVGFSEQIANSSEKGEDHSHYVRELLAEIHRNPIKERPVDSKQDVDTIKLLQELKEPLMAVGSFLGKKDG